MRIHALNGLMKLTPETEAEVCQLESLDKTLDSEGVSHTTIRQWQVLSITVQIKPTLVNENQSDATPNPKPTF